MIFLAVPTDATSHRLEAVAPYLKEHGFSLSSDGYDEPLPPAEGARSTHQRAYRSLTKDSELVISWLDGSVAGKECHYRRFPGGSQATFHDVDAEGAFALPLGTDLRVVKDVKGQHRLLHATNGFLQLQVFANSYTMKDGFVAPASAARFEEVMNVQEGVIRLLLSLDAAERVSPASGENIGGKPVGALIHPSGTIYIRAEDVAKVAGVVAERLPYAQGIVLRQGDLSLLAPAGSTKIRFGDVWEDAGGTLPYQDGSLYIPADAVRRLLR